MNNKVAIENILSEENIEIAKKVIDTVSESVKDSVDTKLNPHESDSSELGKGIDVNGNGIIDDDELTEEQKVEKIKSKKSQRDVRKLFYFVYAFTFILLIAKFVAYFLFDVVIDIDISKLANTLNVAIVFIGSAEGIRSFTMSLGEKVDESSPLPAYKLKHLFGYLIAFSIITIVALLFEFLVKASIEPGVEIASIPSFSVNDFTSGVLSNTLAYLIARFGNKVAEGIDLSDLKFFKKKM